MDSGMWVLGLALIPFICLIIALFLINSINKDNKKRKNSVTIIIIIIILLLPIVNIGINGISKVFENLSYSNVKNLKYEIEQINDWEFNIYFYDKNGNYYYAKKQSFNNQFENEIYLIKASDKKLLGLNINLMNTRTSKVYMKDYKGNKILVWNYEDYK